MLTGNLSRLAAGISVNPLLSSLSALPELWKDITARQDTQGSPHGHTETIFLRWCKGQTIQAVFNELPAIDYPATESLPSVQPIVERIMDMVGSRELGRVLLVSLKSGGIISKHADEGAYADHYERFHLSLQSDEGNLFYVEGQRDFGEYAHMAPGEVWWFNHKRPHWVENRSNRPRLHLIIDAVAPKYRRER